jgi:hypothetical protein
MPPYYILGPRWYGGGLWAEVRNTFEIMQNTYVTEPTYSALYPCIEHTIMCIQYAGPRILAYFASLLMGLCVINHWHANACKALKYFMACIWPACMCLCVCLCVCVCVCHTSITSWHANACGKALNFKFEMHILHEPHSWYIYVLTSWAKKSCICVRRCARPPFFFGKAPEQRRVTVASAWGLVCRCVRVCVCVCARARACVSLRVSLCVCLPALVCMRAAY